MPTVVKMEKIPEQQAVIISVELASYIRAYKNYKNELDVQEADTLSPQFLTYKAEYAYQKETLLDSMSSLTGGCWIDVVNEAMGNKASSIQGSAAYEAMADSFREILKNTVDPSFRT